jgi:hypothetical protein
MAKAQAITKRGELAKLARHLGFQGNDEDLINLLNTAQDSRDANGKPNAEAFIREWLGQPSDQNVDPNKMVPDEKPAGIVHPIGKGDHPADISDVQAQLQEETANLRSNVETMGDKMDVASGQPIVLDMQGLELLPDLTAVHCTGHRTRQVVMQLTRNPVVREVVTRLRHHLHENHAKIANGRHVDDPNQAVIWLLEWYGRLMGITAESLRRPAADLADFAGQRAVSDQLTATLAPTGAE